MEYSILSHVFKELHHTFAGKITGMQDTSFIEELLFHVEVVTPVTSLQEGGMIIKTGLDETSYCS